MKVIMQWNILMKKLKNLLKKFIKKKKNKKQNMNRKLMTYKNKKKVWSWNQMI